MQILAPEQPVMYTILVNQTAMHALPAAINSMSSALLRAVTGDKNARLSVINHPLPTLSHERSIEVSRQTGGLLGFYSLGFWQGLLLQFRIWQAFCKPPYSVFGLDLIVGLREIPS